MKKRNKSKEAKFFCESCGSEVPRNSKTCPVCGKFFASVRCPQCGRIGSNEDFKNGCPTCGYAASGNYGLRGLLGLNSRKRSGARGAYVESSLPFWVYLVSIMILAALVVGLYSCL